MPKFVFVVLLTLSLHAAQVAAETPPRNWGRCPAIVNIETAETLYVLGDTHGDYDRLVQLLAGGKLIARVPDSPEAVTWTGGRSMLIVTGDMIDKWKQSMQVIALMRALTTSAGRQGGRVVISAGNHEVEFLADPANSKTKEFADELKAAGIAPADVANGTDAKGIGKFLLCLPFATRANHWFFSHAGSTNGMTLTQLATALQEGIDKDGYKTPVLLGELGLVEARMKPPWWERPGDTPDQSIFRLRSYADALRVDHIMFGHQPGTYVFNNGKTREKGTLFQNYSGLVFLIDMGMSRGVDYSKGALLRIVPSGSGDMYEVIRIDPDGTETRFWPVM